MESTESIRVLPTNLPSILTEIIVEALSAEPDMRVVPGTDSAALIEHTNAEDVDVVILGGDDVGTVGALLTARPRMHVFTVMAAAGEAWLYELQPRRSRLGELSSESLVTAVREAGRSARSWQMGAVTTGAFDEGGRST